MIVLSATNGRNGGEVGMKETEKVPFDSMPPLIRGSFLTKEQTEKLKEPFKDVVSVVRCKDCKNRFDGCCYNRKSDRTNFGVFVADDWFCADGKRKEDDPDA